MGEGQRLLSVVWHCVHSQWCIYGIVFLAIVVLLSGNHWWEDIFNLEGGEPCPQAFPGSSFKPDSYNISLISRPTPMPLAHPLHCSQHHVQCHMSIWLCILWTLWTCYSYICWYEWITAVSLKINVAGQWETNNQKLNQFCTIAELKV